MDIKSMFRRQQERNEQKKANSKVSLIIEDDDDEDFKDSAAPKRPTTNGKSSSKVVSKSRKRARQRLADESDSDGGAPSKKTKSKQKSTPTRSSPRKSAGNKDKKSTPQKAITSVASFLGSAPIKRAEVKKSPVKEKATKRTVEGQPKQSSPDDLYEIPESPMDAVQFDKEIEKALKASEEKMVHKDEEFRKTLANIDEKPTPPVKKIKLMIERVSVSRSPSGTPQATPTKQEPSKKSTLSPDKKQTKRLAKKGIQYEGDDDDDITVFSSGSSKSVTPKQSPAKPQSTSHRTVVTPKKEKPSPAKPKSTPISHSTTKQSTPSMSRTPTARTPSLSRTPSVSRSTATPDPKSPGMSVNPSGETPKPSRSDSYRQYLNRGGPRAPGSKPIPEGEAGCLDGLTFVITGVLESLEREQAAELIKQYGGKVTSSVSGRTSYMVVGEDAGVSKLAKADKHGTKRLDEDGLLDLIRTRPTKGSNSTTAKKKPASSKQKSASPPKPVTSKQKSPKKVHPPSEAPLKVGKPGASSSSAAGDVVKAVKKEPESLLWVDKYKPLSTKSIIGQKGEKSNAKKLAKWLCNWENNHLKGGGAKRPANRFQDDGSSYKAALLSGPPGIGKTTTATLVCKENGFSYTEMNASAKRNKAAMQGEVATQLTSLSIRSFLDGPGGVIGGEAKSVHKHVLIMDEVDGMAGNEDRGGMQELIAMIKTSKVPVICICNDRQSTKVRSLANHCYDLRFHKPRAEQIKGAMMSVCFKEGIKIEPSALMEMIVASGQDVRQVLHNLSLWGAGDKALSSETAKESARNTQKHSKKGPFDVIRLVFNPREGDREFTMFEKSDLFFHNYSISALFVQENYLSAKPTSARGDPRATLKCIAQAADSLCDGDLVERQIRRTNQWDLLPTQAFLSSVIPGEAMKGFLGKPEFPRWLGQNSKKQKSDRMLQDLRKHTHLSTSCTKLEFGLDYLPFLSSKLIQPLLDKGSDGVAEVVSTMTTYDLLKEDWDAMQELAHFSGRPDRVSLIPSKVKSQFTRTYNKDKHLSHYVTETKKPAKRRTTTDSDLLGEEDEQVALSESEDEGVGDDPMVKEVTRSSKKGVASNGTKKATEKVKAKTKKSKK